VTRLILLGALLACSPAARAQDEPAQDWDGRLTAVSGSVTLIELGGDAEGTPAAAGTPLQEGDRIRTGADSSAELALDGESVIQLGPNADFKLENMHRSETLFGLSAGTFLAKIKKLLASQSMQVRTPTAVAAVRGTEFGVEVPSPEESHVGVFDEGKVEVKGSGGVENLIGNQETRVASDGKPAQPYQLQRFARHRAAVRGFRRRLAVLRKGWKRLPPGARLARRKQILEKMRARRLERLQNLKGRAGKRKDGKRAKDERDKMEKFRERIKRERGGQ